MAPSPDSGNSSAEKFGNGCLAVLAGYATTLGCALILQKFVTPIVVSLHLPSLVRRPFFGLSTMATFVVGGVVTGRIATRRKVLAATFAAVGISILLLLVEKLQGHRLEVLPLLFLVLLECLGGWIATRLPSRKPPAVDKASSSSNTHPPISSPD